MQDAPVRGPDCLSVEEMEMHLSAQESPADREKRSAHLKRCANCATELTLLREFLQAEPRPEECGDVEWIQSRLDSVLPKPAPATSAPRPDEPAASWWERLIGGTNWAWVGAAAAAMLAVGLYIQQSRLPDVPGGLAGGPPVVRSSSLQGLAPSGDLSAPPANLEIEPSAEAASYRFHLEEVDRTVLWTQDSTAPSVELPEQVRALAIPGKALVWRAFALDAAGEQIAETGPIRFRVEPGASQ